MEGREGKRRGRSSSCALLFWFGSGSEKKRGGDARRLGKEGTEQTVISGRRFG